MIRVKFSKLYQMVPSPLKILDKFLFSEPTIEKCLTFEMKIYLTSYSFANGVFFDQRANQRTRKFLRTYHIGCTLFVRGFCAFYLNDLQVYDVNTITFGVVPIIITTSKMLILTYGSCEKIIKFFLDDVDHSKIQIPAGETIHGYINVKKWLIVATCLFLVTQISADAFFDAESRTKINNFLEEPHLIKFFPVWCPFENLWAKKAVSLFQDAIVIPELLIFFTGSLTLFISIIQMHNKFAELLAKLKFISERTFERIEVFDKRLEEASHVSNERTRSSIINGLETEKKNTIGVFHRDFVRCVERYQHLHRGQLLLKNALDYYCSIGYCFILSIMIGFGFTGTEAFANINQEFALIVKTVIWFLISGMIWYMICIVGDLFSRQNDLFADEVYSMPWYHFSPEQRKTVLTFLSIVQKPTYLRALNLVNVKKDSFPDFLNSVYSYIQTMQTLQNVKHRKH